MCELYPSQEVLFYSATKIAKQVLKLQAGDKVIITGGSQMNAPGLTNTIRFETV
jgi:pyruvate kinase